MSESTVVLLHGAGMGAWVWDRVAPLIDAESIALDIPSRSPQATPSRCASSIVSTLNDRGVDRVQLVMHSLAGVLASDLGCLLDRRLMACLYLSAVIPAEGSTFARAIGFPARLLLPVLFRTHPHGLTPSEAMIRKELCIDLSEEDAAMVVTRYQAEFPGLYLSKVGPPPASRSTYVKLMKDMSVTRAQQDRVIARLASPKVIEIDAGHLAMLSRPGELAAIINGSARQEPAADGAPRRH